MIIAIVVLVLDVITKHFINLNMVEGQIIPLIPKVLTFTYVHNTGAAWGIFSNKPRLLVGFICVLMALLVFYLIKYKDASKLEKTSIYLIMAGGIGNLLSRVIYGFVVDFIDIQIIPVFNVADISICVGCGLLMLYVLFFDKEHKDK